MHAFIGDAHKMFYQSFDRMRTGSSVKTVLIFGLGCVTTLLLKLQISPKCPKHGQFKDAVIDLRVPHQFEHAVTVNPYEVDHSLNKSESDTVIRYACCYRDKNNPVEHVGRPFPLNYKITNTVKTYSTFSITISI